MANGISALDRATCTGEAARNRQGIRKEFVVGKQTNRSDSLKRKIRKKSTSSGPQKSSGRRKTYSLRLYITGQTPRSAASIRNIREVCDEFLEGRFELQVIDLYQRPELAKEAQVVAVPTLIRRLPLPLRKLVGDLSNKSEVLLGLDLKE